MRIGAHDVAVVTVVYRDPAGRATRVGLGDRAAATGGRRRRPGRARRDEPPHRLAYVADCRRTARALSSAPWRRRRSPSRSGSAATTAYAVEARKWAWALGELGFEIRRVAGAIEGAGERRRHRAPRARDRPDGAAATGAGRSTPASCAGARRRRPRDRRQHLLAAAQRRRRPRRRARRRATTADACCSAITTCRGSDATSRTSRTSSRRASTARCTRRSICAAGASLHARGLRRRGHHPQLLRSRSAARRPRRDARPCSASRRRLRAASNRRGRSSARTCRARSGSRTQLHALVPGLGACTCGSRDRPRTATRPSSSASSSGRRCRSRSAAPPTAGRRVRGLATSSCFPRRGRDSATRSIESIAARRACAAFPYPVLAEIVAAGVRCFSTEQPETRRKVPRRAAGSAARRYFDVNLRRARVSFSLADLPAAIEQAFAAHGWIAW